MKNKAHHLTNYKFSQGEPILIDANIWLYLFPPPNGLTPSFAKRYSDNFKKLLVAKAQPIIDPLVLSEYMNRYLRIEWEANGKSTYPKFKDYRNSQEFAQAARDLKIISRQILKQCISHSVSPAQINLSQVIDVGSSGKLDFNDAYLVEICREQNFKIMTNDADFQTGGIEVLTNNHNLLRECPSN